MQARAAAAQRRRGLACCLHSAQWDHCDSFGGIGSPCRQPKLPTKTADGRQCDPCHSPASRRSRVDTGHRLSWSAQCEVPPCEAAVIAGTPKDNLTTDYTDEEMIQKELKRSSFFTLTDLVRLTCMSFYPTINV